MNKILLVSIVVSVVVHTLALFAAWYIRFEAGRSSVLVSQPALTQALEMTWQAEQQPPVVEPKTPEIVPEPRPKTQSESPRPVRKLEPATSYIVTDRLPVYTVADSLWDTLTHEKLYMIDTTYLARDDYYPLPDSLLADSTGKANRMFVMDENGMLRPVDLPNPPIDLNIPRLMYQGAKQLGELLAGDKGPPRLDFVPSRAELEALCLIWDEGHITDQNIYTQMDTSIKVSAEQMNDILDALTKKGLLSRRIVSPEYKVLLFVAEVEVSPKNIRNRIYEYEPRVTRQDMQRFLDALYYQAKTGRETGLDIENKDLMDEGYVKSLLDLFYQHN